MLNGIEIGGFAICFTGGIVRAIFYALKMQSSYNKVFILFLHKHMWDLDEFW